MPAWARPRLRSRSTTHLVAWPPWMPPTPVLPRAASPPACPRSEPWISPAARSRTQKRLMPASWRWCTGSGWPPRSAALRAACGEAELLGVQLVMENHNHRGFVQTGSDVLAIMEAVGSPALGLLLDTGNYLDGLASIERTARLAWHVHAKFTQVLDDGRDAQVDQDAAVAALRKVGYKGYVSVEYEGDEPGMTAVPRALGYLDRKSTRLN